MIFITGDCHKNYARFNMENFPIQKSLTKNDYVIICGDFGLWDESKEQKYWLKWFDGKSYTTLWVDGNHENFDLLNSYKISKWKGGKVHQINSSVIHLMRGEIYSINNKTFFTFGGASSHDIQGGILDPDDIEFKKIKKELDEGYLPYRINHVSWWKEEFPTKKEMTYGINNLKKYNNEVDYIITHDGPSSNVKEIKSYYHIDDLNNYFEMIKRSCKYKKWFFGHHHDNYLFENSKEALLYEEIVRLP